MSDSRDDTGPGFDALNDERRRLDLAILGYNRHAILAERHRLLVERFKEARATYETAVASHEHIMAEVQRGLLEREQWRAARARVALHRESVRLNLRRFVHTLRESGMAPERVLLLAKQRLVHCVTVETPSAPSFDARMLESEVSTWTIEAYFEAA
jgi:hypothetical protein